MHIPDNYLSPSTCAALGAVMLPIWRRAAVKVKQELSRKKMPLLGICAAFSFLIMMFNVPLPGGTTGHAVGATLAAILLGPYAAAISVTIALVIQALFFGDGGILAIGANCFNMAFIMPFVGYYIYKFISSRLKGEKGEYVASFIGAYISLNVAAFFTALEFGIQPLLFKDAVGLPLYCPYGIEAAIPAMLIPHLLVAGVIEGVVTTAVYGYVKKTSPSAIYEDTSVKMNPIYGLITAMILFVPIGLLATGTAWGEWGTDEIKDMLGFIPKGMKDGFNFEAIMPDYSISGLPEIAGYILSAVAGVALILIIIKFATKKKHKNHVTY
ncbi:cobalt transporter CbiM [Clostridium ganghwense]|uniref:Cobalt transporter CbiM n=1 Tax=Clostridium ganghwense TaxID=312089 RepID=A0ABT4CPB8_9CLOT|nr:cobalt transporter CbiM [Clostridium ganghwense]MCY6370892.1 cobalt transporter CbiM [Clostridium ganghwense]